MSASDQFAYEFVVFTATASYESLNRMPYLAVWHHDLSSTQLDI
jgi:hypothetical protein